MQMSFWKLQIMDFGLFVLIQLGVGRGNIQKEQEEGGVQEHEDEAGWVKAHTDCAHLNKVTSGLENLARFDAPCSK